MFWLSALVVLAVLTLVGHGLWVLCATIVKALFDVSEAERCRHCQRYGTMTDGRCPWCGRRQADARLADAAGDETADIAAIGRQLRRWQARGLLKPQTVVRWLAKIEALETAPPRTAGAPKPSEATPPVWAEVIETPTRSVPPARPLQPPLRPPFKPVRAEPPIAPQVEPAVPVAAAASQQMPAVTLSPPVARPRRSLAEVLSAFMEERNIRWGELVGGLIIVCSSVALVISIWDQLKAIPYFQFFIFVAVSAALFGVGLYTEHRWKLAATSRGVLIVATLLVPLNFVAMVATRRPGFDPIALVTELAALAVFTLLVYRAGRVLVEVWAAWFTLAVIGNSGTLLLLVGRPSLAWAACVASVAMALHAVSLARPLASVDREQMTAAAANRLFMLAGAAAFAVAVALIMIVARAGDRFEMLHLLAPMLSLGCLPGLLCGLAVMNGLATSDEAALRTAGTAVALAAAAVMLSAIAVAWPMPLGLTTVGAVNFASLAAIALVYRLRPLHVAAAVSLAIAYLVGCHWAAGHLSGVAAAERALALARLMIDGQTGLWLAGFVALMLALAEALVWRGRREDSAYYLYAGGVAAAISLLLVCRPVLLSGGGESARASAVFAMYGIAGLALNLRLRNLVVHYLANALVYAAALLGTTAWLIDRPWVANNPAQFLARPSLQFYASALAAVSLAFLVLRLVARSWRSAFADEPAAAVDRWVLRIVAATALLLAAWQAAPGIGAELFDTPVLAAAWATDTVPGWLLISLCAVGLMAALWDGFRDDDLTAAVLLTVNAAVLAAMPAAMSMATASGLRWALASLFAISAGLLWFRSTLAGVCHRLGCRLQLSAAAAPTARTIWLVLTALPVVFCSALVAAMQIAGSPTAGPLPGTWFARLGMELSHLLPLAAIVLTLIAYAVREASPGYAFLGGAVANLTVVGGYALVIRSFGPVEAAQLVQLGTITAACWAAGWLALRQRVIARRGQPASFMARPLLQAQVAESALGGVLLLATATATIFFASADGLRGTLHAWVAEVGSPLGWFAIAATCGAAVYRRLHFCEGLRPELAGLLGLVGVSLAAASIERFVPGTAWTYRTLMLGWAIYAVAIVVAASRVAVAATPDERPKPLARAAAIWVRVSGLLAVALALKTVLFEGIANEELLWAAPAIAIATAACAAMAVWLRREGWAFTAGLGANLAASLMVAHRLAIAGHKVGEEWVLLWQANTTAAAVVTMVWLTAWRRMYARQVSPAASPLLTLQVGLVVVAGLALALRGTALLAFMPGERLLAERLASNAGWFAWLSACAATGGYLYLAARRMVIDVLAVFLLGVGVRAALLQLPVGPAAAISTLATAWIAAGYALLIAGWVADRWLRTRLDEERGGWLRGVFSRSAFERWIAAIPVLAACVALRGALADAAAGHELGTRLLAAAVLPGALAVWLRSPRHLYSSALAINLAASLFWYAQPEPLWTDLLFANVLAAAATAFFWSLWTRVIGPIDDPRVADVLPPVEHATAIIATSLLSVVALWSWFAAMADTLAPTSPFVAGSLLRWLSCACVATTCGIALWDRRASLAAPCLYATSLAAIALGLVEHGWQQETLLRMTAPCLASWVCATAAVQYALAKGLRVRLRLPEHGTSHDWFSAAQATLALAATGVSIWIGVGFALPVERLAAPVTTALLLAASLLMALGTHGSASGPWRIGALALAALAPAEFAWCWLTGHDATMLALHRQIVLLAAAGLVVAGCEFAASKPFAGAPWLDAIRRFLPLALGSMLALLAAVLVQELHYRAGMPRMPDRTRPDMPMALAAKLAVVVVLVELIVLALRYAIVAARDPLGLSLRGRTVYVYAAELLLLTICLHFRTTMPKLLPFSIVENWWTLIVMAVAFVGAGLGELFRRRRLEVLSEPLAKTAMVAPLLPVFALLLYLVWRPADIEEWLFHARLISDEAVFFLVAAFYGLQAHLRRSLAAAGFSAIAANAGLWLLWHRLRLDFLVHPQLWLIPPALAVLAAEYLNRDRLTRQQSSAVRYLALSAVYVSSTADVFISHVGRDISLPLVLVLLGLSVLGILAGMLLEVRPFIYLGFTFLLVDLSIMVYHAAWDLGHTWVFWATGIAVGAAIIALFAVFEKRRNEAAKADRPGQPL